MSSVAFTSESTAARPRGVARPRSVGQCTGAGRSHRWRVGPTGLPGRAVAVQGCLERWEPDRRQATPCRQIATDCRTGLSDAVGLMRRAGSDEQDARKGIEQPGSSHECRGCSLYAFAPNLTNKQMGLRAAEQHRIGTKCGDRSMTVQGGWRRRSWESRRRSHG